jgi:type VI secretion system secreted protein VgrG
MNNNPMNKNLLAQVTTSLGSSVLQLQEMIAFEGISKLFKFDLCLTSEDRRLDINKIISQPISVSVIKPGEKKYFNAIAYNVAIEERKSGLFYNVQAGPKLAMLQYSKKNRIFQNMDVKSIVKQLLDEYGINDCDLSDLKSTYPVLEYCVQYQESDFDFFSRLLAKYGIFYFFKHSVSKHLLVIADNKQIYFDIYKDIKISGSNGFGIDAWRHSYNFFPGRWTSNDHDFTNPNKKLITQANTSPAISNDNCEIYEYPGCYQDTQTGAGLVKNRVGFLENSYNIVCGKSQYIDFSSGGKFTVNHKNFPKENGNTYVVVGITHYLRSNLTEVNSTKQSIYENEFSAIPSDVVFKPPYPYDKPITPGVQLATIVGPSGKEIYTDNYGRMKVQFTWDRDGKSDEKSSCWIRAVQQWDGLLRIGTPVLVGFIDNDIDRPIILGPVFNANLMPIDTLPDNQTKSTLKRRYIKKENEKKYNQISFEDKADGQQLNVYAAKDMLITVENDFTNNVNAGNYVLKVKGNITIQAEGGIVLDAKKGIQIKAGESIDISANKNITTTAGTSIQNKAKNISNQADIKIESKASMQNIIADGLLTLKGGLIKEN